jgi:hypothetical protein
MRIKGFWVEFEDHRGMRYLAPASNENLQQLQSEVAPEKSKKRKTEKSVRQLLCNNREDTPCSGKSICTLYAFSPFRRKGEHNDKSPS